MLECFTILSAGSAAGHHECHDQHFFKWLYGQRRAGPHTAAISFSSAHSGQVHYFRTLISMCICMKVTSGPSAMGAMKHGRTSTTSSASCMLLQRGQAPRGRRQHWHRSGGPRRRRHPPGRCEMCSLALRTSFAHYSQLVERLLVCLRHMLLWSPGSQMMSVTALSAHLQPPCCLPGTGGGDGGGGGTPAAAATQGT